MPQYTIPQAIVLKKIFKLNHLHCTLAQITYSTHTVPASFDKVILLLLTSPLNLSITPVLFACELHTSVTD